MKYYFTFTSPGHLPGKITKVEGSFPDNKIEIECNEELIDDYNRISTMFSKVSKEIEIKIKEKNVSTKGQYLRSCKIDL
jgi:hypothetical protein